MRSEAPVTGGGDSGPPGPPGPGVVGGGVRKGSEGPGVGDSGKPVDVGDIGAAGPAVLIDDILPSRD
jgi:hypothetical protein